MSERHTYRIFVDSKTAKTALASMTPHNPPLFRKLIATILVGAALIVGGCTVAPKSVPDASATERNESGAPRTDADCGADCGEEEDGVGRYQYYLGILSVLLIG